MSSIILPPDYPIDNDQANKAVGFINSLNHSKGDHARSSGFNLRPWQENKIIRPMFGLLKPNGKRRIRETYVEIPRKNGKSEIAAAIALKLLCADGEQWGEIYGMACDSEQAAIVFNVAVSMVRANEFLDKNCKIIESKLRIIYKPTNSVYRALSKESKGKMGFNASGIIGDEMHEWGEREREMWQTLCTSTGARSQPVIFGITTSGFDRTSFCYEKHTYFKQIRDGLIVDPSRLPVLFCTPEDADPWDEAVWHAVNPALGDFRYIEDLRDSAQLAKTLPREENDFRRLYLCQWTQQECRWLPQAEWAACADEEEEIEKYAGRDCYVGVDLASTKDVAALVLVFPDDLEEEELPAEEAPKEDVGPRITANAPLEAIASVKKTRKSAYAVFPFFFVPELNDRARQAKNHADGVNYTEWINKGWIDATEGNVIDYDFIRAKINALGQVFRIREVAFDPWGSIQLQTQLLSDGFTVVKFQQGMKSMSAPTKELEKLVLSRRLRHADNPVMNWMIDNCSVVTDAAGNIKLTKAKEVDKNKIDGPVALVMALGRAMVREDERSIYEQRGVITL